MGIDWPLLFPPKIYPANTLNMLLSKEELLNGVVTASSGNHGAALSLSVKELGIHAKVVMPRDTSKVSARAGAKAMERLLCGLRMMCQPS